VWASARVAHQVTKNEFQGLMVRCAKHNTFFDPYDKERNAIWFSKLKPEMTLEEANDIVDEFFMTNTKRSIMLADLHEGYKKRHPRPNLTLVETQARLEELDTFEKSISEANRARLKSIRLGMRVPEVPLLDEEEF